MKTRVALAFVFAALVAACAWPAHGAPPPPIPDGIKAIENAFGGSVDGTGATDGQALLWQASIAGWRPGTPASAPTWATVLAAGNTSGAYNPQVDAGQRIILHTASGGASLKGYNGAILQVHNEAGAADSGFLGAAGLGVPNASDGTSWYSFIDHLAYCLAANGYLAWTDTSNEATNHSFDVGLARDAAGVLRVTNGGSGLGALRASTVASRSGSNSLAKMDSNGVGLIAGDQFRWTSDNSTVEAASFDTGLARNAAGVVRVTDGGAGTGGLADTFTSHTVQTLTTSPTTLGATSAELVLVDTSSVTHTVNLPAATTAGAGRRFVVKDKSGAAATRNITIDASGSETIDGALTFIVNGNYQCVTIVTDGTAWYVE